MTTESPRRSFYKSVTALSGARACTMVASFVGAILVSRGLGPSGRGAYSLATTVAVTAALLFGFGVPAAVTWSAGANRIHRGATWAVASIVSGLTFLGCLGGLALLQARHVGQYVRVPAAATAFFAAILCAHGVISGFGLGRRRYGIITQFTVVYGVGTAVLTSVAAVTGEVSVTLYAAIAAALVAGFVIIRSLRSQEPRDIRDRRPYDRVWRRSFLRYSSAAWAGNIVQHLNFSLDLLLIGYWRSTSDVGNYAVAVAMAQALWLLPSVAGEMTLAEVATTTASADEGAGGGDLWMMVRHKVVAVVLVSAALGGILFLIAGRLIGVVLGSVYLPAVRPLRLLVPGVVGFALAQIGGNALAGAGKPGLNTSVAIASVSLTVAGDVLFIPRYGPAGAAAVSTVSYLTSALLTYLVLRHVDRGARRRTPVPDPAA